MKTVLLNLISFFPSRQMFFSQGVDENSEKLYLPDKAV